MGFVSIVRLICSHAKCVMCEYANNRPYNIDVAITLSHIDAPCVCVNARAMSSASFGNHLNFAEPKMMKERMEDTHSNPEFHFFFLQLAPTYHHPFGVSFLTKSTIVTHALFTSLPIPTKAITMP